MAGDAVHIPVLLGEVVEHLALRPGGHYIDATVNGGGHAEAILEATSPDGVVLGIDRDSAVLAALRAGRAGLVNSGRLLLANANFRELGGVLRAAGFPPADAVLFDLGVSSFHFDRSGRGFAFAHDEPLDMRFDPGDAATERAADLLATRDVAELTRIFGEYGEERFASRIARTVVAWRREAPIETTGRLVEAVARSLPPNLRWRAARHAARVFQALRIAVNDELGAVEAVLPQARDALAAGGRLAVISFHSLEDRLVKTFFRNEERAGHLRIVTRKPLVPGAAEIAANPRAASAKLRVAERI